LPHFPSISVEQTCGIANGKTHFNCPDMKPRISTQKSRALTLPELLVVVAMLIILVYVFLSVFAQNGNIRNNNYCVSNLKQVSLSFRIWAGDHDNKYPMAVPAINGGAMESVATGDLVNCFIVMSNELSTPKILVCPEDRGRTAATNFGDDFNASHISYFIGADVTNGDFPQRVLIGDDNFLINGSLVKSGLVQYPTNTSIAWGPDRHKFVGNIGNADGSVNELSSAQLQDSFLQTDVATNRLAIP
jgi:hypothetical protein